MWALLDAFDQADRQLLRVQGLSLYVADQRYWERDPNGARYTATQIETHAGTARKAIFEVFLPVVLEVKRALERSSRLEGEPRWRESNL